MSNNRACSWLLCVVLVAGGAITWTGGRQSASAREEKKGAVSGKVTAKAGNWVEVKADGEEKARRYYCGSDPAALKAVKATEVGSRVRLEWKHREVFRVVRIEVLREPRRDEKK